MKKLLSLGQEITAGFYASTQRQDANLGRGNKISMEGSYGKSSAIIASFAVAVYIVQHSTNNTWNVDMICTV